MLVIVVYVPTSHVEEVIRVLVNAGAGQIGKYRAVAYKQVGLGQFEPMNGAVPYIGEVGVLERVEEVRVEMVCSAEYIRDALKAMINAHPYEEVAYHVLEAKTLDDFIGS